MQNNLIPASLLAQAEKEADAIRARANADFNAARGAARIYLTQIEAQIHGARRELVELISRKEKASQELALIEAKIAAAKISRQ